MNTFLRRLLFALFCVFCCAYPLAVIGIAFNVPSPFSLGRAGSVLLFLEGTLLLLAALLVYKKIYAFVAGLLVIVLSYLVEAIGVNTGLPFGNYRYTHTLLPELPGSVPFPVMFAWVLIVFGAYSWVRSTKSRLAHALLGATLATLLDLAIEPVAAHIVHYWQWLSPGSINYYAIPLVNFAAWFIIAFLLLFLVETLLLQRTTPENKNTKNGAIAALPASHLAPFVPRVLFASNLFIFGLVDLTHAYPGGSLFALLAAIALWWLTHTSKNSFRGDTSQL